LILIIRVLFLKVFTIIVAVTSSSVNQMTWSWDTTWKQKLAS